MRRRVMAILLAVALGQLAGVVRAADGLGRLFYTPEKRAALDRARSLNLRQTQRLEGGSVALEGIVTRSSGPTTVWINGKPRDLANPRDGVLVGVERDASRATVSIPDEAPARLQVGEELDRGTRERRNGLGGGMVRAQGSTKR